MKDGSWRNLEFLQAIDSGSQQVAVLRKKCIIVGPMHPLNFIQKNPVWEGSLFNPCGFASSKQAKHTSTVAPIHLLFPIDSRTPKKWHDFLL